jgi:hypothetical protein
MNTISTIDSKSDNAALAQNSLFGFVSIFCPFDK